MLRVLATRLLLAIPVLALVSLFTFLLVELVPGDPAIQVVGPNGSAEDYERVRQELGLDEPVIQRYWDWLTDALQGDLGNNLVPPITSVIDRLAKAFPINVQLAVMALGMSIAISVPLAVLCAYRPGGRLDRAVSVSMFGLISVPSFLAGIILILMFSINWGLFPLGQWARPSEEGWLKNLHHAFLPALTLALTEIAVFTRLLRNDMMSTLQDDFILAARAKGMPTRHVLVREALRPSSFSLLTLAGVSLGRLIGGTLIVEVLFALPGVGRTVIDGARNSDYTLVQGGVLIIAVVYVLVNIAVDVLYTFLDPRVRRGHV